MRKILSVLVAMGLVMTAVGLVGPSADAAIGSSPSETVWTSFSECLGAKKNLSIELVLDTSESLQGKNDNGRDPTLRGAPPQRVIAARGVLSGLQKLEKELVPKGRGSVRVKVSGFSGSYEPGIWRAASDELLNQEVDAFTNRNRGSYTNFLRALEGAQRSLKDELNGVGDSRCTAILLFTDGALDVDNKPGIGIADRAAETALCSPSDGPVKALRDQGTKVFSIGLVPSTDLEAIRILNRISQGAGDCGGQFDSAAGEVIIVDDRETLPRELDKLVESIREGSDVPEIRQPCSEKFYIPPTADHSHIFTTTDSAWDKFEIWREGETLQIDKPALEASSGVINSETFSAEIILRTKTALVVELTSIQHARGDNRPWLIGLGESAQAQCSVLLFEDWTPKLQSVPSKFERGKPAKIHVTVKDKDGKSVASALRGMNPTWKSSVVVMVQDPLDANSDLEFPAENTEDAPGRYTSTIEIPNSWTTRYVVLGARFSVVNGADSRFAVSALAKTEDVDLETRPEFAQLETKLPFTLSKVKGTGTAVGEILYTGSKTNDSSLWVDAPTVKSIPAEDGSAEGLPTKHPSADKALVVPANKSRSIKVEVRVRDSGDGEASGSITVHLHTDMAGVTDADTVEVLPFTFQMERKVCSACRISLTVLLMALALLLPLLILWVLNWAAAKFEPPSELRAASLKLEVNRDGEVRLLEESFAEIGPDDFVNIGTAAGNRVRSFELDTPGSAEIWSFKSVTPRNPFSAAFGVMETSGIGASGSLGAFRRSPVLARVPLALRGAWVFRLLELEANEVDSDTSENEETDYLAIGELLIFVSSSEPEVEQARSIVGMASSALPAAAAALAQDVFRSRAKDLSKLEDVESRAAGDDLVLGIRPPGDDGGFSSSGLNPPGSDPFFSGYGAGDGSYSAPSDLTDPFDSGSGISPPS